MAKNNKATEETTVEDVNMQLGNVDESALASLQFEEVDPLKGLDATFNAGQDGFLAGTTKLGIFKGTKICTSTKAKKPRWHLCEGQDPKNSGAKVQRKLHIFQATTPSGEILKAHFGLWGAGSLSAALDRVGKEQLLAVTYLGKADKPFRQGDAPPHLFKIRGRGIEIKMSDLADIEGDVQGEEDLPVTPGIHQNGTTQTGVRASA